MYSFEPFLPPFFLQNCHVQTLLPFLIGNSSKTYRRERLELDDGDFIDLDFSGTGDNIVLILHGLEGSSSSRYVVSYSTLFEAAGYSVCAMNYRGCSGEDNRLPHTYHSGATDDLHSVITFLQSQYSSIFIIGFSVGGNITLKYLAKETNSSIKSATCISVPISLSSCANELAEKKNRLYMQYFLRKLIPKVRAKKQKFTNYPSLKNLDSVENFWQFDEMVTAPLFGFDSADDYYTQASSITDLQNIKIPTLLLNALDDPFLGTSCYPAADSLSHHITAYYPNSGGHVGFIDPRLGAHSWAAFLAHSFFLHNKSSH